MNRSEVDRPEGEASRTARALRFDLIIAVCALLISSFASAASWWQARLLNEQTRVLQEQLGAQVWPYVGISETLLGDVVAFSIENDGLGPAVLRSESVSVDGRPQSSMIGVLHAVLGPSLHAQSHRGERVGLGIDVRPPGSVLRPGDSANIMKFTSARLAVRLAHDFGRIRFRVCYCAIVPGQCWISDSGSTGDPQATAACTELRDDLMHVLPTQALSRDV